jgi:cytidylate kinase
VIVAVDGPAAAGKGTLARRIAAHFGLAYLDTGLLYRAVGFELVRQGTDPADAAAAAQAARALRAADLDDDRLRGEAAAAAASITAAMPAVRAALLEFQRAFAAHPPAGAKGAVIDGRDIGTVVCPGAAVKFFITATTQVRAERRLRELQTRGEDAIYARVLADMQARDARDSQRDIAPLVAAEDAYVLDTSALDADAVFVRAIDHMNSRR